MSNILCIDDEPSVGVVLEHHLTEIGHQPTLASSMPPGAVLYLEAKDFGALLNDWNGSPEKAAWPYLS